MPPLVVPLNDVPDSGYPQFGAKAVNLARLIRLGLPVPSGFCVSAEAYQSHLRNANLRNLIRTAVQDVRAAWIDAKQTRLAEVRRSIIDAPLAVELRLEVERAYQALDSGYLAVRSSGTAEDLPGHSFAGLYSTFLSKADIWTCLGQIKECWASLWTERAFEYREKNRFDHLNASMSVLVQKLVPAEASGVAFTVDPVTGAEDNITIESCFGLGEALVSGKVTPDRYVLAKKGLRVVERTISNKAVHVVFAQEWGVREWPVEDERREQPSINEATARRVAELALKVEQAFGEPQGIEWATINKESSRAQEFKSSKATGRSSTPDLVFLLQARPVTAKKAQELKSSTVWSNVNIGEAMPEPAPPLAHSGFRIFARDLLSYIGRMAGVNMSSGDLPLFKEIAGREYFNLSLLMGMVRGIPLVGRVSMNELLGGLPESEPPVLEDTPVVKTNRWKALVGMPGLALFFLRSQPDGGRKAVARLKEQTNQLQRTDYSTWPDADLPGQVTWGLRQVLDHPGEFGGAMTGLQSFTLLTRVLRQWLGEPNSTLASKLLVGLGDIDSAQAGLELWHLADIARARPELEKLIRSGRPWVDLRPELTKVELGEEFLQRWDALMFSGGHHCRGEFDIGKPRWRELPDFVLGAIRSYVAAGEELNPEAQLKVQVAEREQLAEECRRRLRNPIKRAAFNFLLKQAQAGACVRENLRDDINRRVAIARMALLELGDRLARRGIIAERDDIFFLYESELIPVLKGSQSFDVRNTIADRQAEHQRNLTIAPPPVVTGEFKPEDFKPEAIDENAESLSGLAVSPGIVTGPARVIMRYSQDEQVRPGEILVAPFTDPGWTPYFLPAAGIVVNIGGMLSHGSIVIREYGKPAVVNVGPATSIIKTGQMVQVDGNQGKVRIIRPRNLAAD
jgi:pyruvate,water dikinase